MNKSKIQLLVVAGILAVGIGVVMALLIQWNTAIEEHNAFCRNWASDLDSELAQLNARADTIGGALDLSGNLEAARIAYNQEVADYSVECASEQR